MTGEGEVVGRSCQGLGGGDIVACDEDQISRDISQRASIMNDVQKVNFCERRQLQDDLPSRSIIFMSPRIVHRIGIYIMLEVKALCMLLDIVNIHQG